MSARGPTADHVPARGATGGGPTHRSARTILVALALVIAAPAITPAAVPAGVGIARAGALVPAFVPAAATTTGAGSPGAPVDPPTGTGVVTGSTVKPFAPTTEEPVAPGVVRTEGTWTTSDGIQSVEIVAVDPAAEGISLEVSRPAGGVHALETVRSQAARQTADGHRVVAAVNGDVWSTDTGTGMHAPIGVAIHRGELLTGTRAAHPTLGFDADEVPHMADVAVRTSLTFPDGVTRVTVDRVNKPRRTGDTILYSRRWGTATGTRKGGVEVVLTGAALPLRPSGTWTARVASVGGSAGDTKIANGTLVLSADGADEPVLKRLAKGMVVTLSITTTAGWEGMVEAIGGREWLREDGFESIRPVAAVTTSAHPRTAVGLRADGTLVLAVVDGRQPTYSIGVRATDLASLLGDQGAVDAIMLDGGGSSTALVRRPGNVEATVVNKPSDGRERRVDNALFVVSSTKTGPLAGILVRPARSTVVVGERTTLAARGYDAAWNGVPIPAGSVTWSLDGTGGTLSSDGRYAALEPGSATASAAALGMTGTAGLTTVADTFAPGAVRPDVAFQRGATVGDGDIPVTITWPAATDVGTGVAGYEVRRRLDGGPWEAIPLPTPLARSLTTRLATGHAFQYSVRATDKAGNAGAWASGQGVVLRQASERSARIRYSTRWRTRSDATALGGGLRSAGARGSTASYVFTANEIAWVAPRGTTRGTAKVYIDGRRVASIDLRRSTSQARRAVFTYAFEAVGRHRLTVKVNGTAGHPRVDVDGFVTAEPVSGIPVLVGAGDIATCSLSGDSATAALIDRIPGTVFAAGDVSNDTGSAAELADCYDPTWGRFKERTRPVPGNHDYATAGAAPYYEYFGEQAGTAGQGWYAYDMGAWRVYGLNSNCSFAGGCDEGSAQLDWLKADLAAHPRACVAAYWHHPLFSSGESGNNAEIKPFWDVLQAAGAELVINGHDHDYERFSPQTPAGAASSTGIREFVVGTGGAALRPFAGVKANSKARIAGVSGVLRLELKTTGYTWSFLPATGAASTDTGSASCH